MKKAIFILLIAAILLTTGCIRKNQAEKSDISVLVFITGVIAGSPTYELMAEGALEYAKLNPMANIKIYEAGVNQALWEQQLTEMVSEGIYDIVMGSNPAMPQLCVNVARLFPDQKFIILDAHHEGHPQIRTYFYNQYEQSLILGYLAGLITTSNMPYANNRKRIGFIAAQEYPLLTGHMVPGFIEGARMVDPQIELDYRLVGSWNDANKASDLASAMMSSGVDVFTSIAGGAAQGLIKTAVERGAYIVWYNANAYNLAPGFIVGCGIMEQKKLVIEILNDAAMNKIQYGLSDILGLKDGYLGFIFDDPGYYDNIPLEIREKFEAFVKDRMSI
ncbi:MAG: BMP family ABC transporter substrate-binding protein [Treponema sp.]|nr:BMP family ABC transporter substrate-binding protein [Treponema sp.]